MAYSPASEPVPDPALAHAYEPRSRWAALRDSLTPVGFGFGLEPWREFVGPGLFWIAAVALLVYDHMQHRWSNLVFWLTLALVASVFVWLVLKNRERADLIEYQRVSALQDAVTGLYNRSQLEADVAAALAQPLGRQVVMLVELEGLQAQHERFGYAAGDAILSRIAQRLTEAVAPLGGQAYRADGTQLAAVVPLLDRQLGEIVIAATGPLTEADGEVVVEAVHGEVVIPDEASEPAQAFAAASHRLAVRRERQHSSAKRQAHSALLAVISARRPELRDHRRDLAGRVLAVGRQLQIGDDQLDDIVRAAQLQDIGLLAVPESVLEKEDGLSLQEQELIREHPAAGAEIINAAPGLETVAELVRASCERYDGMGYPNGLAGEEIPLGSRIVAACVAFAAMTAQRPYRDSALTEQRALEELRHDAGTQFDPAVVEALAATVPPPA